MNKLLEEHADRLKENFEDYCNFNLKHELSKTMIYEKGMMKLPKNIKDFDEIYKTALEISPLLPVFEIINNNAELKSKRFFEIIRVSSAISNFIRGVDQYSAAVKMSKTGYSQFTIFAYYSSIFQLMTSFINLHGIVYIPKVIENYDSIPIEEKSKDGKTVELYNVHQDFSTFIVGNYNKNKNWDFRKIGLNHKQRWKDFADTLKLYLDNNWESEIPIGIKKFWGFFKLVEEYKFNFFKEGYKPNIDFKNKKEFKNCLNQFYKNPSKIRHRKIYENRRNEGIKLESGVLTEELVFFDCCRDFVAWQFNIIKEFLAYVKESSSSQKVYIRGISAISDNPVVMIDRPALFFIQNNEEIIKINKNIPYLIELFLSDIEENDDILFV